MHFLWRELPRNHSHLLKDVVLANALRELAELALDIGGLLLLQRRRSELEATGPMACGTGRNATIRCLGRD